MKCQAAEMLPDFFSGSKDPKAKNDDLSFMIFDGIPDGFVLILLCIFMDRVSEYLSGGYMKEFISLIGKFASEYIWFGKVADDILVESLLIYTVLQVCCAVGLHGVFAKMNAKKRWAAVPAANVAYLGDLCGCKLAGCVIALCKICALVAAEGVVRVYTIPLVDRDILAYHCGVTFILIVAILLLRTIAGCFLYRKLIRKFGLEGWWMFFFLLAPNLTTLFFGFNPDIRG